MNTILKAGGDDPTGLTIGKPKNVGWFYRSGATIYWAWYDKDGKWNTKAGKTATIGDWDGSLSVRFVKDCWIYQATEVSSTEHYKKGNTPYFLSANTYVKGSELGFSINFSIIMVFTEDIP